jgi:hypothetical protein
MNPRSRSPPPSIPDEADALAAHAEAAAAVDGGVEGDEDAAGDEVVTPRDSAEVMDGVEEDAAAEIHPSRAVEMDREDDRDENDSGEEVPNDEEDVGEIGLSRFRLKHAPPAGDAMLPWHLRRTFIVVERNGVPVPGTWAERGNFVLLAGASGPAGHSAPRPAVGCGAFSAALRGRVRRGGAGGAASAADAADSADGFSSRATFGDIARRRFRALGGIAAGEGAGLVGGSAGRAKGLAMCEALTPPPVLAHIKKYELYKLF